MRKRPGAIVGHCADCNGAVCGRHAKYVRRVNERTEEEEMVLLCPRDVRAQTATVQRTAIKALV